MRTFLLSTVVLINLFSFTANAQEFDKAEDYIGFIKKNHKDIYTEVATYVRKLENGSPLPETEGQRRAVLKKLAPVIVNIHGMPSYKSDKTLQDSLAAYMRRTYWILDKEYPSIQKLQDSASRTFASAQKYAMAKSATLNKLIQDERDFFTGLKQFSSKYGVAVPANYDDEFEKLLTIKDVSNHHNALLLIYSKTKSLDAPVERAIQTKNKAELEEKTGVLQKAVKDGYAVLDTIKPYKQDKSLMDATRGLLNFYQIECEFKVPSLLHFLVKGEDPANSRANIENSESVATYANTKADLDLERPVAIDKWKKASLAFLKKYLSE